MRRFLKWLAMLVVVAVVGLMGYQWLTGNSLLPGQTPTAQRSSGTETEPLTATVTIRAADSAIGRVSAAGHIALNRQHYVVLESAGVVSSVHYQLGDEIAAGESLLALDTTDLERALRRAQLSFDASKTTLAQLIEPADANERAQLEANLRSAEAKLTSVQAGATEAELAAARARVSSAWALYRERTAPMSEAKQTQLAADLKKAEIALQAAQREYDRVSWANDAGMTSQAAALQDATVDYERVKADYTIATEGATQSDIQSALSSAQEAQQQLDDLLAQPFAADLASAEAEVASAQAALANLDRGATELEIQAAEIELQRVLVDLEEAHANLQKAQVTAPISGTIIQLDATVGQQLTAGSVVAILADLNALELPVQVAEVDIDEIEIGQAAEITIDALLGRPFMGEVTRIAPVSGGTSDVINYTVTIRLTDEDLRGVRPDMTAVAEFVNSELTGGWLVPTTALQRANGAATLTVVRNGQSDVISVTPGAVQGEWTVVQSADLQAGDQVVGTVASYVEEDNPFGGGPGGPGGGPGGG